jgi:hypothetical protein
MHCPRCATLVSQISIDNTLAQSLRLDQDLPAAEAGQAPMVALVAIACPTLWARHQARPTVAELTLPRPRPRLSLQDQEPAPCRTASSPSRSKLEEQKLPTYDATSSWRNARDASEYRSFDPLQPMMPIAGGTDICATEHATSTLESTWAQMDMGGVNVSQNGYGFGVEVGV